jgi:hypothetical protein
MRISYLILTGLVFIYIGCSPKGGPEQTLRMKDGREIECRLLAVRANGLVVDTSKPPAHHITNAEIGLYPFESIDKFVYDPVSASKTVLLSSFTGFAVGATAGYIIGKNEESGGDVGGFRFYYGLGLGILGTIPGALIGAIINDSAYDEYTPSNPNDREQIAKLAIYKTEEPDELKKIQ